MFKLGDLLMEEEAGGEAPAGGEGVIESEVPNGEPTEEASAVEEATEVSETEEVIEGEPEGEPEVKSEEEGPTEEVDDEPFKYTFDGQEVEVVVPDDIKSAFDEKGIDADEIMKDLFSGDDFSLSEDNRAKLEEAFGKHLVDGYLNLYQEQNRAKLKAIEENASAEEAKQQAMQNEFDTLVGGDEGWEELVGFAEEHLDPAQLEAMNTVMSLGKEHWHAQKACIDAIKMQMQFKAEQSGTLVGQIANEGDSSRGSITPESKGYLTAEEYSNLMSSEGLFNPANYRKNPEAKARVQLLDSLRQAGIQKGK